MKILEKIVGKGAGNYLKRMTYATGIGLAVLCSSCDSQPVRGRIGSYASATIATAFQGLKDLGQYDSSSEGNGQVYCCNCGHIDIAHLRKSADWTRYLSEITHKHLINNNTDFSFAFKEPSKYFVKLTYPENWGNLKSEDKEQIAKDVSIELGQYFSYTGVTWHEILTWFGYKSSGFYPEFPSAFSWEDEFSNLLGTYLAGGVLKDIDGFDNSMFNKEMTSVLERELQKLGVQPSRVSRYAGEKMRGKWYSGDFLSVQMKKRNLDIGLDDGSVTPWLIPGVRECEGAKAKSYPIPKLDVLSKYGFSIKLEIEPHEWEKDKILKIVGGKNRIEPLKDFPIIMDYIKKEAVRMYGNDFDKPY